MSVNNELQYVTFSRDGMDDFQSVVLPNIYEQLYLLDRFDKNNISALGAMIDGRAVGALVAQITGEAEAVIHSVYVDEEFRRTGIATELFNRFLSIANMSLDPSFGKGSNVVPVAISVDYALPLEDADVFRKYLESLEFKAFAERPDAYCFKSDMLLQFGRKEENVFCFADIEGTTEREIFDYYDSLGIAAAVKYSFYCGAKDDPDAMLLVSFGDDDVFVFSSVQLNDSLKESEYEKLISSAIDAIRNDYKDFVVIANGADNIMPECWTRLAESFGMVVKHNAAELTVIFE